ncbi:MAG: hypothetical protein K2R98_04045 [Gemmataceae bacterium]|nr:hypothetical protein [Gemmataceae bacterium]
MTPEEQKLVNPEAKADELNNADLDKVVGGGAIGDAAAPVGHGARSGGR